MAQIRVRARALDMLGRQQIAGIPTAISELFKNAHDAYADSVEVDFFRQQSLLVLRDDGNGMTLQDFESRWLTLGTESKVNAGVGLQPPKRDLFTAERPIMGEKGIGRLAIAAVGPQVLVLTRAHFNESADELIAAFVNWGVFALPGIDIAEVDIPIRRFAGGTVPNAQDIAGMIAEVRANVIRLTNGQPDAARKIETDLDAFTVDPASLMRRLKVGPSLANNGRGTHFFVQPVDSTLADDIDGRPEDDVAPPLLKTLIGFTNTMTPKHAPARILTRFRDHRADGLSEERIADNAFFTPNEFRGADHHITGTFDEFGQFKGNVAIYGSVPVEHMIPWTGAKGDRVQCGPFKIEFAYVHAEASATRLPPQEHAQLLAKLNKIGGLYIYRDDIRILPYGNSDYDFLSIEKRRTKSAYYYFFSYRRLFGVIDINRRDNFNLVEKAGREGFRENLAYRQFKSILENFFVQMAADFFRDGHQSDAFTQINAEFERNHKLRQERAKQARVLRQALSDRLDEFFRDVGKRIPEIEVTAVISTVVGTYAALAGTVKTDQTDEKLIDLESETSDLLMAADERFRIAKPRNVGMTKQLQRDWDAYQSERKRLEEKVFLPARVELTKIVNEYAGQLQNAWNNRIRLSRAINLISDRERRKAVSLRNETRKQVNDVENRVLALTKEGLTAVEEVIRITISEFERSNVSVLTPTEFNTLRVSVEAKITTVAEREIGNLERLREQLREVGTPAGLQMVEITSALEEEVEELRRKEAAGLDLAQIGMAISVVQHEFSSTIQAVRNNLRRLKPWADANAKLGAIFKDVRNSFDHLDGYLTLFTPLNRRLQRRQMEITGREVHAFLADLFGERLIRHEVDIVATERFDRNSLVGYAASIFPTFVNLVDNAIFWLGNKHEGKKIISLDAEDGAFIVSDNGPGIPPRDGGAIFEAGFTRKPGGRGLGLHISREVLGRDGYALTLEPRIEGRGASFRISKKDPSSAPSENDLGESGVSE